MKLIVEEHPFELAEEVKKSMQYIEEYEAIEGAREEIKLDNLTKASVEKAIEACNLVSCNFPEVAKVKGSDPKEYIGNNLTDFYTQLSYAQLNDLFKAAHFLKIKGLVNTVTAFLACRVYIPLSLDSYKEKMEELKIKTPLTNELSQEYRNRYTFLL